MSIHAHSPDPADYTTWSVGQYKHSRFKIQDSGNCDSGVYRNKRTKVQYIQINKHHNMIEHVTMMLNQSYKAVKVYVILIVMLMYINITSDDDFCRGL